MTLRVMSAGPLTTVQDRGRFGWRHLGVACAGALDPFSMQLANWLVANPDDAAVLEMTLHGPTLELLHPTRIALCGAQVDAWHQNSMALRSSRTGIPGGKPVDLPAGVLHLGGLINGARSWLAIAGGVDVPKVLGSRSADLRAGLEGLAGHPLRKGDSLPTANIEPGGRNSCRSPRIPDWWIDPDAYEPVGAPIRYVASSHPSAVGLADVDWKVGQHSNRQGIRLQGDPLAHEPGDGISAPVAPGTIQLPADGQPIVLLADAQTVGGYPRLGHVIAADLPGLAQRRPGEALRFIGVDPVAARQAWEERCATHARLRHAIEARLSDRG